ncbi:hypothetical protein PHYBOEH_010307 [Phytophthora boehmeriae]|uniref:Transmembrane protein 138 n=1 Tax=Phytophthora boehmeriae TaxID=109152 RepID=A0A8T1X8Z7_9STRA|nr:hypothetical protein PHYBOEH_010307 [Phytophthora boehmeriae]
MKTKRDLPPFFQVSAALAGCLYLVDVALNASVEYGDLPGQNPLDSGSDAIVAFVQILLQIAALVNFLVLLGGTFLFRSGLFGMLYEQFRLVLLVQPLYIGLTVVLGILRVNLLSTDISLVEIWDTQGYTVLSSIHKLGALRSIRLLHKLHLRSGKASTAQILQSRILAAAMKVVNPSTFLCLVDRHI